jgi:hypothetical protein
MSIGLCYWWAVVKGYSSPWIFLLACWPLMGFIVVALLPATYKDAPPHGANETETGKK